MAYRERGDPPEPCRERGVSIQDAGRGDAYRSELREPAGRCPSEVPSTEPHGLAWDAGIGTHSAGLIRPQRGSARAPGPSLGSATTPAWALKNPESGNLENPDYQGLYQQMGAPGREDLRCRLRWSFGRFGDRQVPPVGNTVDRRLRPAPTTSVTRSSAPCGQIQISIRSRQLSTTCGFWRSPRRADRPTSRCATTCHCWMPSRPLSRKEPGRRRSGTRHRPTSTQPRALNLC